MYNSPCYYVTQACLSNFRPPGVCNKIVDRALCKTKETEAFPCSIVHTQTHTHTPSKVSSLVASKPQTMRKHKGSASISVDALNRALK